MLRDVGHPLQGRHHRGRQKRGGRTLDRTVLRGRGVPVQAERGLSLREEGVAEKSRGRRREGRDPQPAVYLHPEPPQMIRVRVTVEVAVVDLVCGVQRVELVAAAEVDVRFLSEPSGATVGGAWSPDREEFISQVTLPETTKCVEGQ